MNLAASSASLEISVDYVEVPRFDFSDEEERELGLAYLSEHGYVVCASVLSEEEIKKGKDLFWEFIGNIPDRLDQESPEYGIKEQMELDGLAVRGDPATWCDGSWFGDPTTGINGTYGANHSLFAWFVRSRPKVKAAFEAVWGTDDLLTSFDAINTFRPWQFEESWRTKGGWYHVDQNATSKPDRVCVQGLVNLFDTTSETGGLTVIPRSQLEFKSIGERLKGTVPSHDFVVMPKNELERLGNGRLVVCRAGDLCLWDSRTVHCNTPGVLPPPAEEKVAGGVQEAQRGAQSETKGGGESGVTDKPAMAGMPDLRGLSYQEKQRARRELKRAAKKDEYDRKKREREWGLLRLVAYVCMTPTRMATRDTINKRVAAVASRTGSSHWPHLFTPSGRAQPPYMRENPYLVPELIRGNSRSQCTIL